MKISSRFLLCAGVLGALALPSQALLTSSYPGLDGLIAEADTIAVVRVENAFSGSAMDGWTKRNCYVYQTLKGDLKAETQVAISLNMFISIRADSVVMPAPGTTHLVFLNHSKNPIGGANYSIVCSEGADLPLSPLGNETKPAGKTLKAQIQTLIRRYKTYRDEQIKREDNLLDEALAE